MEAIKNCLNLNKGTKNEKKPTNNYTAIGNITTFCV